MQQSLLPLLHQLLLLLRWQRMLHWLLLLAAIVLAVTLCIAVVIIAPVTKLPPPVENAALCSQTTQQVVYGFTRHGRVLLRHAHTITQTKASTGQVRRMHSSSELLYPGLTTITGLPRTPLYHRSNTVTARYRSHGFDNVGACNEQHRRQACAHVCGGHLLCQGASSTTAC